MSRETISSGAYLEPEIGFSRAVRIGHEILVSGTAHIAMDVTSDCPADVYEQTKRCLEIIGAALRETEAPMSTVARTRIMLTDIATWIKAAKAHGDVCGSVRRQALLSKSGALSILD
ncbi:Rid family hydrolase [Mesobaculum littorinae]|uniref:Rid family hydrolase n=1 Tax=Mesobaculum littorinae TaxID=2486419 RepID=UPI001EEB0642|nr:Rid family hydrolase [Mesobaculum littorinae]